MDVTCDRCGRAALGTGIHRPNGRFRGDDEPRHPRDAGPVFWRCYTCLKGLDPVHCHRCGIRIDHGPGIGLINATQTLQFPEPDHPVAATLYTCKGCISSRGDHPGQ